MAFRASWMARCIIAYIRDSWNGSSRGAMHALVAATPACAFQAVMASPPAGAANAARDSGATGPGDWVNTPARRAITRTTGSCTRITHLIFLASSLHLLIYAGSIAPCGGYSRAYCPPDFLVDCACVGVPSGMAREPE